MFVRKIPFDLSFGSGLRKEPWMKFPERKSVRAIQLQKGEFFPYLRQTLRDGDVANPQRCTFNLQHDDIEDTLNDLTNLLLKYIPSDVSSDERIDMLLDTYALSHDIGKHAMMEDRILLPYIQFLESQSHD